MSFPVTLAILLAAAASPPETGAMQSGLRTQVDAAMEGGISSTELETLSNEAFHLADQATSRISFWNAISLVAELCQVGPCLDARGVRVRALEALAQHDSDTMRWSSLVTRRFLPAFEKIPRDEWARELAAYDDALDALCEQTSSDRVRSELIYAKAFSRVFIDRRWNWLTERERRKTLGILADLAGRFGDLPLPGTSGPRVRTVGQRARQHDYELNELHFGAPAPPTSGIDLEGNPLDVGDYRGKVIVVDFWTSFCQPCLALVPGVRELLGDFEGEPVVYLGVCGDTERLAGRATAQRVGMTWRNLWDGPLGTDGPAATAWDVSAIGWPSVFVIDQEGRIQYKLRGKEQVEAELEQALRYLLAERKE